MANAPMSCRLKITRCLRSPRFSVRVLLILFCFIVSVPSPARALRATSAEDPRVLLLYVDGLRPDTVDALVAEGKLPTIKRLFYQDGTRLENFFTVFPSNTIIANGTYMTGKEPRHTGIKSQAFFERFRTEPKHWYEWLWPWGRGKFPRQMNLLASPHMIPGLLHRSKTKALYDYLGEGFHPAIIPINRYPAPTAWPHVAGNTVENAWHVTHNAADNFDLVNGAYALNYMTTDTKAQVFLVWFPMLDEDQHRSETGQFGETRHRMVEADEWLAQMMSDLAPKYPNLYTILFSDHGAIGGENGIYNQQYYLGRDLFYEKLKMNVIGPDYGMTYPGTNQSSFVYVDNMGRGQAKIYLPVKDATSADWERPNTFYELTHYGRGPNRESVNLIETLASLKLEKQNAFPEKTPPFPVDMIFVKLSPELIYARSTTRGEALIRARGEDKDLALQYTPITNFSQDENGKLHYEETAAGDAFGYLNDPSFTGENPAAFFKDFHTSREWLDATYKTAYPDAVPAVSRLLFWDNHAEAVAKSQDPDIVLSAMPGWNFRIEDIKSADHGYIARESMRATLMISGPKIKKGAVLTAPYRIAQMTPTILELAGYTGKTNFDEEAIHEIYQV